MHQAKRDAVFLRVAELWAEQSTCLRGHTAAIIVRDNRQVSAGFNGAPPGMPHCTDVGCESVPFELGIESEEAALARAGCQRSIHAELNAIAWAARAGISTESATMYTLSQPCLRCAQAIISAGIEEVVWRNVYRAARLDLLDAAFIKIRQA